MKLTLHDNVSQSVDIYIDTSSCNFADGGRHAIV